MNALAQRQVPAATTGAATPTDLRRLALLLLLCLAPLPLACAGPEARAWLTVAAGSVGAYLIADARRSGATVALPPGSPWFLAFGVVPLLQLLPCPGTPSPLLGDLVPGHGSVVPMRTWHTLVELLAWFVVMVAAATTAHGASGPRRTVATALVVGTLLVGHGALLQTGFLPLLDPEQHRTVMLGTFVNRNHFANLLAMLALAGIGLWMVLRQRSAHPALQALVLGGVAVQVVGIVAAQSRGAAVGLGTGLLALALLVGRSTLRQRLRLLAVAAVMAIAAGAWLLPSGFAARFTQISSEVHGTGNRLDIWRGALALWAEFPWLGTGLGTYGDVSPATQPAAVPGRLEHAHCEPLEWLVETGLCGTLLAVATALAFLVPTARRCLQVHDRERALLASGLLSALVATGTQALVEFQLRIPANALWTAAFAGLAAGLLRSRRAPVSGRHFAIALGLAVLVVVAGLSRAIAPADGQGLAAITDGRAALAADPAAASRLATTALAANPLSPRAHRLAAEAALGRDADAARRHFAASLRWTNPADRPRHQLDVAVICLAAGAADEARHWLADLFLAPSTTRRDQLLDALYRAVPATEVLLPLLPADRELHHQFGEVLLQKGDFAGREAALADAASGELPLLTLPHEVRLLAAAHTVTSTPSGTDIAVALRFHRPPQAAAVPLVLHCERPGAAVYRSFAADADAWRWTIHLDHTFPAGEYRLTLDFRADAPHFPFGTVTLADRELDLRAGTTIAATHLHWWTADPGRRDHDPKSLPLRAGDAAGRTVSLPAGPAELVVQADAGQRLQALLDDVPLEVLDHGQRLHRFRLPDGAERSGRLVLRGAEATVTLHGLFVSRRPQ